MKVWDCHSDLLSKLLERPLEDFLGGASPAGGEAERPPLHCTLERLRAGRVRALVCALFTRDAAGEHPVVRTLRMIDIAHRLEHLSGGAVRVLPPEVPLASIEAAPDDTIWLVLSIENGIACLDRLELLRTYHRLGVRAMGLVWNGRNWIADGCGEEMSGGGLTAFGREVVAEMDRLGMRVDVSHLSESGFWDVMEHSRGPVIASHSNVRALTDHPRNLRDAQIRAIAERGGVIGLNFYPAFLARPGREAVTIEDLVAHALALLERAGEDAVGIGADFDGIPQGPAGAQDPSAFGRFAEALRAAGLSERQLDKLLWSNFRRVFAT